MGLRFDPIGGGQFKQLVQQLIEIEREPIKRLEARKNTEEEKIKLFQQFKGMFTELQASLNAVDNFKKLIELKADLGDGEGAMSVTLDKEMAQPGTYQFQIDELAEKAAMISNSFASKEEPNLGLGFVVVYQPNGEPFEVLIEEGESSLQNIASKINSLRDAPVQASVIRDAYDMEKPYRLLVSAKNDGMDADLVFPEFYFMNGDQSIWVEDDKYAQNSLIKVDGFEVETDGNDVPNFIQGVNIKLKEARPGRPFNLSISVDPQKVTEKITKLVESMNKVLKFVNDQNKIDDKTDTSKTFAGDTGLTNVEYRLRNLMHEAFPSGNVATGQYKLVHLHEIGLEFAKSGEITFKVEQFQQKLEEDFDAVADAISGEFGFAFQLGTVLQGYTRPYDGLLSLREKSLQNRVKQIDTNIANTERQVEQRAQALTDRFSRLQGTLGALQQQSAYVQANLGGGGGGNVVSQLLGG